VDALAHKGVLASRMLTCRRRIYRRLIVFICAKVVKKQVANTYKNKKMTNNAKIVSLFEMR
jgi:hypothetical protein